VVVVVIVTVKVVGREGGTMRETVAIKGLVVGREGVTILVKGPVARRERVPIRARVRVRITGKVIGSKKGR
jgi:hypothetical protein